MQRAKNVIEADKEWRMSMGRAIGLVGACCVLVAAGLPQQAQAGVTFRLDRLQAGPGETVRVEAMFFNDGNAVASWNAPKELILQWRDSSGNVLRTLAPLEGASAALEIPAGRFSQVRWVATVPAGVKGLQAVAIEGEPVLLALDTSSEERGAVVGSRAFGPVIDPRAPIGQAQIPDTGILSAVSGTNPGPAVVVGSALVGPSPSEVEAANQYENSTMERFRSALSPYEPVYFSLGLREDLHARFQISLKYRLFQPPENQQPSFLDNLYFGYTQTSLWDLGEDSKPFRDSSYRPSFFWLNERLWESSGRRWSLGMSGGLEHESNGRGGVESRSINVAYARPALSYRFENGSTLSFAPKIRHYLDREDNPDIADYRGYADYEIRWAKDDGPMVSALLRQGSKKGSVQIDLAYPLRDTWLERLNGYLHVQYFNGYGETLLDYNQRARSQIRIGLMIVR